MPTKTLEELQKALARHEAKVKKLKKEISQLGFANELIVGVYVHGKINDGTKFSNARLLAKTEAKSQSGEWYKLRLNEDTADEEVKSVRLSNIDGIESK